MNVSLTEELELFVRAKVESGLYTSSSEVVRAALRLLKREDDAEQRKLDALRADIREGLESGEPIDADTVFDGLKQELV